MLRLLTLGGAAVVNESSDDVSPATTQRRTIALLSVLAVAGYSGVNRERLIALLWPNTEPDRGRHALAQALYTARRVLACETLFDVEGDLRIRPGQLTSDIADFEGLRSDDPEAAVGLYKGPFLDGFVLPGSTEFEQWSVVQRTRIENQMIEALDRLGSSATNPRDSLRWWKRAAALRPLDGKIAVRLMAALVASGDRPGALKHAAIYSALLRDELALDPDPAVTDLAASLRAPSPTISPDTVAAIATSDSILARSGASEQRPRNKRRLNRASVLVTAITALALAAIVVSRRHSNSTTAAKLPFTHHIIVAPFRVGGADPSLSYLRDGIVELLMARLSSNVRATDAGAVLGAWRAAGISPAMDVPRDTVVEVARRFHAERVILGGVVGAPRHIVIRATMLRVPTAAVVSQAIVEGPADSVTSLVARLAADLLGTTSAAAAARSRSDTRTFATFSRP